MFTRKTRASRLGECPCANFERVQVVLRVHVHVKVSEPGLVVNTDRFPMVVAIRSVIFTDTRVDWFIVYCSMCMAGNLISLVLRRLVRGR